MNEIYSLDFLNEKSAVYIQKVIKIDASMPLLATEGH